MLELFEPKLGKLVSKLKLKLKIFIYIELVICLDSKVSSSMKLDFDEMQAQLSTI